ncbi:MAG: NfeD family protein [Thermoprotei archaeon]
MEVFYFKSRYTLFIRYTLLSLIILSLVLMVSIVNLHAQSRPVILMEVSGVITEGTYEDLEGAIDYATSLNAPLLLVINTPGGSLDSTVKIVEVILNSKIPVIGYVYPHGATGWSAGSLLLLSTHIAAMAHGTVIGSAQPVYYDPIAGSRPVNDTKIINAVATYFKEIAKVRNRNETAAQDFVIKNLNLGADEALKYNVIDSVADNVEELLFKINGKIVKTAQGEITLETLNAEIIKFNTGIRNTIVRILQDPIISYLSFMLGLYVLIFGLASTHHAISAIGILLILISLVGMGLSINTLSIILIAMGLILLLIELFIIPGFTLTGVTGIIMLVLGILMLPLSTTPEKWIIHSDWYEQVRLYMIASITPLTIFSAISLYKILQAKRMKPKLYISGIIGQECITLDEISSEKPGFILCQGEYWMAQSTEEKIKKGEKVIVIDKKGPVLLVKRKTETQQS